jgi:putative DNA primase/helicase
MPKNNLKPIVPAVAVIEPNTAAKDKENPNSGDEKNGKEERCSNSNAPIELATESCNAEARPYKKELVSPTKIVGAIDSQQIIEIDVGTTAGGKAASAADGEVALPDLGLNRPDSVTDLNDLATDCSKEAVRKVNVSAVASWAGGDQDEEDETEDSSQDTTGINFESPETGVSQVSGVQASDDGLSAVTPAATPQVSRVSKVLDALGGSDGSGQSDASGVSDLVPTAKHRPKFRVFDDGLKDGDKKLKPGVWYFDTDKDGNLTQTWVCSHYT